VLAVWFGEEELIVEWWNRDVLSAEFMRTVTQKLNHSFLDEGVTYAFDNVTVSGFFPLDPQ